MVLLRADRVDVLVNLAQINRHTFQDNLIGLNEIVLQVGIPQVERMGVAGHTRPIVIPVEQVEGRWLLAQ